MITSLGSKEKSHRSSGSSSSLMSKSWVTSHPGGVPKLTSTLFTLYPPALFKAPAEEGAVLVLVADGAVDAEEEPPSIW